MKKFTKILICLMLCVFGISFAACDKRSEKEKNFTYPPKNAEVVGNGGLAVQKGNYVYFVNGYKSVADITNKKAKYNVGSLMLTKLDENGDVVKDEKDLMHDDYFIKMTSKLSGYEASNLYIYGEYLYFASPCLENEKGDKVWAKERVIIHRIKLDKTGKIETVYESGVKVENLVYEYFETEDDLYILAWEKGESYYSKNGTDALVRIDATSKSSKVVAKNVKSFAFDQSTNNVFFVQKDEEYTLNKFDIVENKTSAYETKDEEFAVLAVASDKVFITKTHNTSAENKTVDVFASNIETETGFEMICSYADGEKVFATTDGSAVVVVSAGVLRIVDVNNGDKFYVQDGSETIEIVGFVNGCVVYYATKDSATKLKMVSYSNLIQNNSAEIIELTEIAGSVYKFDIESDDNYIYFFNQEGSNIYLNRIKAQNNVNEEKEMFGVYNESDIPEEKVETEEEE